MAQMNPFSLRLVMADYYLSRPISELDVTFSEFRGSEIKQLPVVRVFGATPDGRKACLHVHGVFPYLYIPCEDPNPEPKTAYQIANSIDKALNISLKQANSTNQHVYKVHLVRGIPFYGFHSKVHQFYKIFFYNPSFIKRASDLLQSGAILGSSYQPHEAHINFTMQFFLDFNLYGMSFINLDYVKFRRKGLPILHTNEIKEDMYLPESVEFTSCCELEADCLAQHILNRKDVLGGNLGTNPGLEALWEDEKQRLVNTDMSNSLVPTPSQARENVPPTASHIHNQQLLLTKLTLNSEMQNNPLNANQTQSDIQFTPEALSKAVYPAETPEESDILNATSVSLHHPTSVLRTWDVCSDTTVDESLVLHLSQNMHLSRVNLDSDDMDFMVMLRDMEDKIEEDSVLGTQLNIHREEDLEEEKQPNFDELFTEESVENVEEPSQSALWNDTYWDNVQNISQLDGAWDTEDQSKKSTVKKKGKLKIGLSKPRKYIAGGIKQDVDCQSPDGKSISKKIEEFKIELSSPISPKKSPKRPLNLNPLTGFFKTSPTIGHKFSLTAFKSIENEKKKDVLESVPTTPAGPGPGPGTLTSSGYDRLNSYFPVAGTSTAYQNDTSDISIHQSSSSDENDLGVISFYDTTLHQDSSFINKRFTDFTHNTPLATCGEHSPAPTTKPSSRNDPVNLHYDVSSSGAEEFDVNVIKKESLDRTKKRMVLVAEQPPPLYSDVVGTMEEHSIPGCTHRQPFYSKAQDVGSHIEVGQIILKIKSKTLADLKPFMSHITDSSTLETWRENVFLMKNITQNHLSINDLTAVLASNTRYILTPVVQPPSAGEVTDWLLSSDDECLNIKNALPVPSKDNSIVYLPPSPGQDTSNSQVETLSISPASAEDSTPPESAPAVSKSTTKKRKSLSQPARKLRPRALRLSLAAPPPAPQLEVICGSSPDSNDYEIPCGQKSLNVLKASEHIEDELDKFKMSDKALDMTAEAMEGVTGNSTLGFKFSGENFQDAATLHEHEYLTVLVLEVLTSTRGEMYPDPALDPVLALFYSLLHDGPPHHTRAQQETGVIISRDDGTTSYLEGINKNTKITFVQNEECIFEELLSLMGKWDPDILCGYEIEMLSWGYLFQRGFILDMNLPSKISRVPLEVKPDWKKFSPEISKEIKLVGRITLDVWRLLRHEVSLTSYSFESVMYHVMHERVPKFSFRTLHFWWSHPSGLLRCEAVDYLLTRVIGVGHILQQLDLVGKIYLKGDMLSIVDATTRNVAGRTSELARLFGIQWYEVLSRGSQFRVESMMFRMTRPRNYVLVSPSVQQRAAMRAPECLPLILEPESRFYSDPVIVLDFQSLYPSMMIAYNYCFSTCVGSIRNMGRDTPYEFGCTQLRVPPGLLERLARAGQLNWSPVGAGFVRPAVRRGVLPLLLTDILRTRLMVKKAMKKHKHNKTLQKILHSRQLGLKLIANVTYGYAAANFSGRMPCVEVADSVVAKGRETLTRAIQLVHSTPRWGARVVYGDTDSLFVLVAGRSRSEAFNIGAEIAEAVTNDNPSPVKLKLEKVFHPCILQTKKRYVGYMYESKDQTTPEYCAKGIETVRRDGCPIASKMLEKTLRILFESGDVSKVKAYVCGEFQKIMEGNCNIRDFVFAKEFRGLNNYKPGASLPALEIARQVKERDARREPREGERVPYVVVAGAPGEALLRLARPPLELLACPALRLHAPYYISRAIIPPLNRCLTLLGADANLWFAEIPRKQVQLYPILEFSSEGKKSTIAQYFATVSCAGCAEPAGGGLCGTCLRSPQKTMLTLQTKMSRWQRKLDQTNKICQSCCGSAAPPDCVSADCPVLFRRASARQDALQIPFVNKMAQKLIDF